MEEGITQIRTTQTTRMPIPIWEVATPTLPIWALTPTTSNSNSNNSTITTHQINSFHTLIKICHPITTHIWTCKEANTLMEMEITTTKCNLRIPITNRAKVPTTRAHLPTTTTIMTPIMTTNRSSRIAISPLSHNLAPLHRRSCLKSPQLMRLQEWPAPQLSRFRVLIPTTLISPLSWKVLKVEARIRNMRPLMRSWRITLNSRDLWFRDLIIWNLFYIGGTQEILDQLWMLLMRKSVILVDMGVMGSIKYIV